MATIRNKPDLRTELAFSVRQAAEIVYRSKVLSGKCGIVSYVLYTCWRGMGIPARLVQGVYVGNNRPYHKHEGHVWVYSFDDLIWDLSCTQFDRKADPVSIIPMPCDPPYKQLEDISGRDNQLTITLQGGQESCEGIMRKAAELFGRRL